MENNKEMYLRWLKRAEASRDVEMILYCGKKLEECEEEEATGVMGKPIDVIDFVVKTDALFEVERFISEIKRIQPHARIHVELNL